MTKCQKFLRADKPKGPGACLTVRQDEKVPTRWPKMTWGPAGRVGDANKRRFGEGGKKAVGQGKAVTTRGTGGHGRRETGRNNSSGWLVGAGQRARREQPLLIMLVTVSSSGLPACMGLAGSGRVGHKHMLESTRLGWLGGMGDTHRLR